MAKHARILGYLHAVLGGIGALCGLAGLLIVAALFLVAAATGRLRRGDATIPMIGTMGAVSAACALIISVPSLIAGLGLLKLRPWARPLTLVISVIDLFALPVGTALGAYGLWVLLSKQGAQLFLRSGPGAPAT